MESHDFNVTIFYNGNLIIEEHELIHNFGPFMPKIGFIRIKTNIEYLNNYLSLDDKIFNTNTKIINAENTEYTILCGKYDYIGHAKIIKNGIDFILKDDKLMIKMDNIINATVLYNGAELLIREIEKYMDLLLGKNIDINNNRFSVDLSIRSDNRNININFDLDICIFARKYGLIFNTVVWYNLSNAIDIETRLIVISNRINDLDLYTEVVLVNGEIKIYKGFIHKLFDNNKKFIHYYVTVIKSQSLINKCCDTTILEKYIFTGDISDFKSVYASANLAKSAKSK